MHKKDVLILPLSRSLLSLAMVWSISLHPQFCLLVRPSARTNFMTLIVTSLGMCVYVHGSSCTLVTVHRNVFR